MIVEDKTKEELVNELEKLHKRINELESGEIECKKAEESLQESEERFRDLLENANDLIQSVNAEGRFIYVNKKWLETLGYSKEEIKELKLRDILRKDQIPHCMELFKRVRDGESLDKVETVFIAKDGREIYVEGTANARIEEGQFIATRSIFRDITERKKIKEDLESSEEQLRILFEFAPDAIYLCDFNGNIIDGNKAAEKLLGYKKEELIGEGYLGMKLVPLEQIPRAATNLAKNVLGQPTGPDEFTLLRKDGSGVEVEIRTFPVEIKGRALVLGVARDITERKKIDEKLKMEAELLDAATDAIILHDLDGNFIYLNKAAYEMLGYSKDELMKMNLRDVENPEQAKLVKPKINELREKGEATFESGIFPKNGSIVQVEIHARVIESEGRKLVLSIVHDIAERKQAEEEQLRLRRRLESLWKIARMIDAEYQTLCYQVLVEIMPMTESRYGFYGFLNKDESMLTIYAWSKEVLEACQTQDKPFEYPIAQAGLWGDAVRERRTLIINDYQAYHPSKKGLPEGHVQLTRVLVVPIFSHGHIVAVAAVANKETEYTEEDAEQINAFVTSAQVVLEKRHTEKALRESEEKYRTLFESAREGIITSNAEDKIISANPAAAEMLGYASPQELVSMSTSELYADLEQKGKLLEELMENGYVVSYELNLKKKDGAPVTVLSSTIIHRTSDGNILRAESIFSDITERKQVMEEIQRNCNTQTVINTLLQISLENVPPEELAVRALDLILSIPWLSFESRGSIFLVEDEPETLVRKAQSGLSESAQESCARVPFGRCLCGRAAMTREIQFAGFLDERHEVKYEGIIPHGHYCVPILSASRPLGVINLFLREGHPRDPKEEEFLTAVAHTIAGAITRWQTSETVKQMEEQYRGLIGGLDAIVWEANAESWQFTFVSPHAEILLGYPVSRWLNEPNFWLDHIHPDDRSTAVSVCQTAIQEGQNHDFEYRMIKTDGTSIWLRDIVTVEHLAGKPASLRGIMVDITPLKQAEEELQNTLAKLRKALGGTIRVMALTVETKDPYTAGHQRRVADLARTIATEMGLSGDQIDGIRMAGVIHDIGKISVPGEILTKPGRISEIELNLIRNHPQVGYDILKTIDFPWPIAQIILQHHERMNGSGYPSGISGEDILIEARILGVADVVEAMASHRPYRSALGIAEALEEISKNKGVLYDPNVVDACLKLFTEKEYEFE